MSGTVDNLFTQGDTKYHEAIHDDADRPPVDKGQGLQVHEMSFEDRVTAMKVAGFDGTVMSSVNSMKQFQGYFAIKAATSTSLVFGIFTLGSVCSALLSMYLPDKFGRRWAMFIGNIVLCAGACLSAFAQNLSMFIGGRFLTGIGSGLAAAGAKSYMSEIAPSATRGRWLGLLNSFYYVGQIIASGVSVPLGRVLTNWAWRTPILLQAVPAAINAAFVLFLFESPRWLYAHGKVERATEVLAQLHSRTGDTQSPLVLLEIGEIEEAISMEGGDKRWWDPRPLLRTRNDRYRAGMGAIVAVWQTLAGNGLITYFLPTLLGQAGIHDTNKQRILNLVNSITSMIGAFTGVTLIDHVGRRKLMLFSATTCMCGMAIVSGLLSNVSSGNQGRANAGIAFIFLFMVFYSAGWTPMAGTYPAECFSYENRAKGLAYWGLFQSGFACINTFGLPVAIAVMKWKVYLIFVFMNMAGIAVIWLFCVETKQLSLEDLQFVFDAENPKRASFELHRLARERARVERPTVDQGA